LQHHNQGETLLSLEIQKTMLTCVVLGSTVLAPINAEGLAYCKITGIHLPNSPAVEGYYELLRIRLGASGGSSEKQQQQQGDQSPPGVAISAGLTMAMGRGKSSRHTLNMVMGTGGKFMSATSRRVSKSVQRLESSTLDSTLRSLLASPWEAIRRTLAAERERNFAEDFYYLACLQLSLLFNEQRVKWEEERFKIVRRQTEGECRKYISQCRAMKLPVQVEALEAIAQRRSDYDRQMFQVVRVELDTRVSLVKEFAELAMKLWCVLKTKTRMGEESKKLRFLPCVLNSLVVFAKVLQSHVRVLQKKVFVLPPKNLAALFCPSEPLLLCLGLKKREGRLTDDILVAVENAVNEDGVHPSAFDLTPVNPFVQEKKMYLTSFLPLRKERRGTGKETTS